MIKFIVTLGFGFTGGQNYIPTLGFTPGTAVAVRNGGDFWEAAGPLDFADPASTPASLDFWEPAP